MKVDTSRCRSNAAGDIFTRSARRAQDLFVLYMRQGVKGAEEVLVDPATLSADHTTSVNFEGVSEDGKIVAYGVRKGGEDEVSLHFFDTERGKTVSDVLPRTGIGSGLTFRKGQERILLFEVRRTKAAGLFSRHGRRIRRTIPKFSARLHAGQDFVGVGVSEDGEYLLLTVFYGSACERSEVYVQDFEDWRADRTGGRIDHGVFPGQRSAGDTLYLQTNWKAPKWRLMAVPLRDASQENWKEVDSRRRVADRRVPTSWREDRRAAYCAQRGVGTESISGGWKLGGRIRVAATGNRGGISRRDGKATRFFFVSVVRDSVHGLPIRCGGARRWTCGRSRRCRWTRARSR